MYNEVFLKFMSKKENISIIRNTISALLLEKNPTITFINELKTVISEITTNSIVHGYEADESKSIEIFVVLDDEKFSCIIKDFGKGIEDVDKAKEPLFSTKKEEERSGLGFTIMEMFTDLLVVNSTLNKGTEVYFEKKW
jgi:stage II sporulation protein AB (anti-sigma F factor)